MELLEIFVTKQMSKIKKNILVFKPILGLTVCLALNLYFKLNIIFLITTLYIQCHKIKLSCKNKMFAWQAKYLDRFR